MNSIRKKILLIFLIFLGNNLLHSEDFWKNMNFPYKDTLNRVRFSTNNTCYVLGKQNIYKSSDLITWKKLKINFNTTYFIHIEITKNNYIFLVDFYKGIFRSKDEGETWEYIFNKNIYYLNIIEFNKDLYLSTYGEEMYKSSDYGDTWVNISEGKPISKAVPSNFIIGSDGSMYLSGYKPNSPTKGVFKSTDLGNSWDIFTTFPGRYGDLAVNSFNEVYLCTYNIENKGIYKSDEEMNTFAPVNEGLDSSAVYPIFINKNDEIFICTRDKNIFYSNNYGKSWIKRSDGLTNPSVNNFTQDRNNYLYTTGYIGGLYRSINPIKTFKLQTKVIPDTAIIALAGDKINFEINTFDENNKQIPEARIKIIDSLKINFETVYNDANGVYNYSTTVPFNIPIGTYPIKFIVTKPGSISKDTITRIVKIETFIGVNETLNSNSDIYPNPFDERIVIENSKILSNNCKFKLIDQLGNVVSNENFIIDSTNDYKIILKNINLEKGFYMAVINIGKETLKFKLIKK